MKFTVWSDDRRQCNDVSASLPHVVHVAAHSAYISMCGFLHVFLVNCGATFVLCAKVRRMHDETVARAYDATVEFDMHPIMHMRVRFISVSTLSYI